MSFVRTSTVVSAGLVLLFSLACGGSSAPEPSATSSDAQAAAPSAASASTTAGKQATPRPAGMKDNLALTPDINSFPMLSGKPNPDFAEGDIVLGLAKLSAPADTLVVADGKGEFAVVLHEDGNVLHRHEWSWPVKRFDAKSPMLLVNLVPSKDMGGKGEDWTPGFAKALDGLSGAHTLTFQIESPNASPSVIAIAEFSYTGGGPGDYAKVAKDLEDFLGGKGAYAAKPKASGKGMISTTLKNNCADNAKVTMTAPNGSKSSVTIPAARSKTVTVQMGTRLSAYGTTKGAKLNQRLKALDREFYNGMTSNLCN